MVFEEDHQEYLEAFRNCPATDVFYFWFDTHSNPPANDDFKDVTTDPDLPSEWAAYKHEQDQDLDYEQR